jgi:hypothetical protein
LSVDIDDIRRIKRLRLQRSGRTEEQEQGQQDPMSRHDKLRFNAPAAGTGLLKVPRASYGQPETEFQEKRSCFRIASARLDDAFAVPDSLSSRAGDGR